MGITFDVYLLILIVPHRTRYSVFMLHSGLPHPIMRLKTLHTTEYTYQKIQQWYWIVTLCTTMKNATLIREWRRRSNFTNTDVQNTWSFKFDPNRYYEDELSCSDSAKLSNIMDRDHWTFGAGYVFSSAAAYSKQLTISWQSEDLSRATCCWAWVVASDITPDMVL